MKSKISLIFAMVILLIALDQLTKVLILNHFQVKHIGSDYYYVQNSDAEITVLGEFIKFVYVENAGIAFGLQFGEFKIFLTLFSIFASIFLTILLVKLKNHHLWVQISFAFILSGAVGNLIDRLFYGVIFGYSPLFYGRVVDFIQVDIPDISIGKIHYTHWPVFNLADSCVSVGVVLLLIFSKHLPSFLSLFSKNKNFQKIDGQ